MTENILARLFEHNNWANDEIIRACSALTDEQLDATPRSPSEWSIRQTLTHIVESQQAYLSLLTIPADARLDASVAFSDLGEVARTSGEELLDLVRDETGEHLDRPVRSIDGYVLEPWLILVQAINHATEHRRQICSLMRAQKVAPPRLDGWGFGEAAGAIVPDSAEG